MHVKGTVCWASWFCLCTKSAFHGSRVEEFFCSSCKKKVHFDKFMQRSCWKLLKMYGFMYAWMYLCCKRKKNLHIEVTYIWCDRLHELIPLIQKAYQIDKQALNTDSALHLTYKWNISNSVTINANLLPLGWWQREVLRCLTTNPTLSSSSLRGLIRTHFCSACCLLHNRRPEWHFLQGQRYKVICFWMPYQQGAS